MSTVDTGVPIYDCLLSGSDRWVTTDKAECIAKGYTVVGEIGYAAK